MLKIEKTTLAGVLILTPARFGDARGFFSESWNATRMAEAGLDYSFVQDNHSMSEKAGTIRGLHYQTPPQAQAKLVRCGRGAIYDVAVDIRKGSPTFGHWVGVELSFNNGKQLLIPEGFLHGFVTREPMSEIVYKCSTHYTPDCDAAIRFDDPDIGIDWGIDTARAVLSEKDISAPFLKDVPSPFTWKG